MKFKLPSIQSVYDQAIALTDGITTLIKGKAVPVKKIWRNLFMINPFVKIKYVTINCSAIGDLLESGFSGIKRSVYRSSEKTRPFNEADGGTIFLDEIGDISAYMQQSLLRVIQEGIIMPIGGKEQKINVRIIAATHQNLSEKCKKGEFRWDLYYRLSIVELTLPSLLERGRKDIKSMLKFFLKKKKKDLNKSKVLKLSKAAEELLLDYSYPGNIREMENINLNSTCFMKNKSNKPIYPQNLIKKTRINL